MDITDWVIAASGATTAFFAGVQFSFNRQMEKKRRRDDLDRELRHILDLTVKYPYLEHESITKHWTENKNKMGPKFIRYDQFCNILFNYLEKVYNFYSGDKRKIEEYLDVKSWVRLHEQNWKNPIIPYENNESYSVDFRNFINSYL